jgi:hypothetical protein
MGFLLVKSLACYSNLFIHLERLKISIVRVKKYGTKKAKNSVLEIIPSNLYVGLKNTKNKVNLSMLPKRNRNPSRFLSFSLKRNNPVKTKIANAVLIL